MVKDKRIEGISRIEDHSDRAGMCITIDVKREASAGVVLNNLYKYSQMQITYGVINLAIVDGVPKVLTLHDMLDEYLKHQLQVILRRTIHDLRKAKERAHILEGLKIALDYIDEVIAIIRSSKSIPESKERLCERFGLDDIQANAIVQMRLGQLSGLEREKIEDELAEIKVKIEDFEDIIAREERRRVIVGDELAVISKKYASERKTVIEAISGEMDVEDLIPEEECVITMTAMGYVKRQKMENYQIQHRGGRGIAGMQKREEDTPMEMFIGCTHDYVMFFTNQGRVYRLKGYEIPEGGRNAKGMNIVNLLELQPEEKITNMIRVEREYDSERYMVMVTQQGIIKRTPLSAFANCRKRGLIALTLKEDDQLVWARLTEGDRELIIGTRKGMAIRFNETDIRIMGRTAAGVRGIRLQPGDTVIGMSVVRPESRVLTVSENGFGRLSPMDNYRIQSRGGKGITNYRQSVGDVAAIRVVDDDNDIIIINDAGVIIRIAVSEIRECARPAKGVRLMRLAGDTKIVAIARVQHSDEEAEKLEHDENENPDEGAETAEELAAAEAVEEEIVEEDEAEQEAADSEE